MPDLTRDQLTDVCKRARVVYEDELRLFGLETVNSFAITGGVVRAVVEALEGAGYAVARIPAECDLNANDIAEPVSVQMHRSDGPCSGSLSEPTATEVAGDRTPGANWTEEQRELYHQVAIAIKRMARGGYMPTQVQWDADKPGDLPKRMMLCRKLDCTWAELAAMLGLKVQHRGGNPKRGKAADRAHADVESDPPTTPDLVAVPETGTRIAAPPITLPKLNGTLILGEDGLAQAVVMERGETLAQRNERVYGAN